MPDGKFKPAVRDMSNFIRIGDGRKQDPAPRFLRRKNLERRPSQAASLLFGSVTSEELRRRLRG